MCVTEQRDGTLAENSSEKAAPATAVQGNDESNSLRTAGLVPRKPGGNRFLQPMSIESTASVDSTDGRNGSKTIGRSAVRSFSKNNGNYTSGGGGGGNADINDSGQYRIIKV